MRQRQFCFGFIFVGVFICFFCNVRAGVGLQRLSLNKNEVTTKYDLLMDEQYLELENQKLIDQIEIYSDFNVESPLSLKYGSILLKDLTYELTSPFRWKREDWTSVIIRALIIKNTMTFLDLTARDIADDNQTHATAKFANTFNQFGGSYPKYILRGFYVYGLLTGDKTAKMVGLDMLSALFVTNMVVTPGLKTLFGRARPYTNTGIDNFKTNSGNTSFPSGHTTRAFVMASVIASHYDQQWVKILAYSVAGMVALSRVHDDAHFLSDVVAGAFIGIAIGKSTVKLNKKIRSSGY